MEKVQASSQEPKEFPTTVSMWWEACPMTVVKVECPTKCKFAL